MLQPIRLWVDDVRPPQDKTMWWVRSVNEAIFLIKDRPVVFIDLDHDAGDFACNGGDYIKLLDWLEEHNINSITFHIHSMNPVGVMNMRRIIQKNHWKEI